MATKPNRAQQQACDHLAEALVLIAAAARIDGKGGLDPDALGEAVRLAGRAASAFAPDEILARALDRRARALGLPASAAELLTLLDSGLTPAELLLLDDDPFRDLVARLERELGDV